MKRSPPDLPKTIGLIAMDIAVGLDLYMKDCARQNIKITIPDLLRALDYIQADLTELYLDRNPEAKRHGI